MAMKLLDHPDKLLHLNADCMPVRGAARSAIYDLTRGDILLFPTKYFSWLEYLEGRKVADILELTDGDDGNKELLEFLSFLDEHDLIAIVDDLELFPAIQERWEMPGSIQNAVIDVGADVHDFSALFNELDLLGCQFVQIRSFAGQFGIAEARYVLDLARHQSFESVELILMFDAGAADRDYADLVVRHPILAALIVHSAPTDRDLPVDDGSSDLEHPITKHVRFRSQKITSALQCGMIGIEQFTAPSVSTFFEAKLHNGCLNGKIAIDTSGHIKNCPSMGTSFGRIASTKLRDVVRNEAFRALWVVRKDQITICSDCEFRYACSDCRAYVTAPDNVYSKPLKCGYDPYSAEWRDWRTSPMNASAIAYYGFETRSKSDPRDVGEAPLS